MSTKSGPTMKDVSIINWNTAEAKTVASGLGKDAL